MSSLIRYTIKVDKPNLLLETYQVLEVYRSGTKYGSYTEVSTSGTRPILQEDQVFYDFDDSDGTEFFWYKWRAVNTASGDVSTWSAPSRGYVPNTNYCGLDDVKRNLRASDDDRRIRFSESYKNLEADNGNAGDIQLSEVSFGPDYSGQLPFEVEFTGILEFKVSVGEDYKIAKRVIGTGRRDQDFFANDNSVSILSSDWSGVAEEGDKIRFDSDSHMSTNDAIRYVNDAEIFVDMLLEQYLSYDEAKERSLRFSREDVPKTIAMATAKFAAFFIYSTIYSENAFPDAATSINDIGETGGKKNDLSSWSIQGNELVKGYVKKYTKYFNNLTGKSVRNGPRWEATQSIFDATGVVGVGEPIRFPELNEFQSRANMSYDGLLDYDLLVGGAL